MRSGWGLYVVGMNERAARKLMDVPYEVPPPGVQVRPDVEWSPDGAHILLSGRQTILMIDTRDGRFSKVADGVYARSSPAANMISYVSDRFEPSVLDLATGKSRVIDPSHETYVPVEWSPDGRYLFILEGKGSHVPYGCIWVFKIATDSFFPIPSYGVGRPQPGWLQLETPWEVSRFHRETAST